MFSPKWLYMVLTASSIFAGTFAARDSPPVIDQNRVQLAGFLKRKEGLSKEEFTRRWLAHGELFRSLDIAKPILKYEELHLNEETNELLASTGATTLDWDGIAIMEATSYEELLGILTSPEHEEVIVPDEETFLDRNATAVMPLNFAIIIDRDAKVKKGPWGYHYSLP